MTGTDQRSNERAAFLASTDWRDAEQRPLTGDASNRSYFRLRNSAAGDTMLMDAAPEVGEDVRPFAAITGLLRGWGYGAPEILAADLDRGFLVLEDLGDALYARALEADPSLETEFYETAVDLLAELAGSFTSQMPPMFEQYVAMIDSGRYDSTTLRLATGADNLRAIADFGRQSGVDTRLIETAVRTLDEATEAGHGINLAAVFETLRKPRD